MPLQSRQASILATQPPSSNSNQETVNQDNRTTLWNLGPTTIYERCSNVHLRDHPFPTVTQPRSWWYHVQPSSLADCLQNSTTSHWITDTVITSTGSLICTWSRFSHRSGTTWWASSNIGSGGTTTWWFPEHRYVPSLHPRIYNTQVHSILKALLARFCCSYD